MSVAIEQRSEHDLYQYLIGDSIEKSLECLSEKLGRDERFFWDIVRVSKGNSKAPDKLKVADTWLNTTEFAERLFSAMLVHTTDGKKLSRDIRAAKIFLNIINNGGEERN